MKALEFVEKFLSLREGADPEIFTKEVTFEDCRAQFPNLSEAELFRIYLIRYRLSDCFLHLRNSVNNMTIHVNEIDYLIAHYDLWGVGRMVDITFLDEIVDAEDGLYAFAIFDVAYLCFDEEDRIGWYDYDTFDLYNIVSLSSEAFLDCLYLIAQYKVTLSGSVDLLVDKLVESSGVSDSRRFFNSCVGLEDL